jgi:hypothetical protein
MVGILKVPMVERITEPIIPASADTLRLLFFLPIEVIRDEMSVLYNLQNQTRRCMEGDMTVYKPYPYSRRYISLTDF